MIRVANWLTLSLSRTLIFFKAIQTYNGNTNSTNYIDNDNDSNNEKNC